MPDRPEGRGIRAWRRRDDRPQRRSHRARAWARAAGGFGRGRGHVDELHAAPAPLATARRIVGPPQLAATPRPARGPTGVGCRIRRSGRRARGSRLPESMGGSGRRGDRDASSPPFAKDGLHHPERRVPVFVGPVAEADVEVVDGHESGALPQPHRRGGSHQRIPLLARGPVEPARTGPTPVAEAALADRRQRSAAPAPRPADHEQVPVGGRRPGHDVMTLPIGLVDESEHEGARPGAEPRPRRRRLGGREPLGQGIDPGTTRARKPGRGPTDSVDRRGIDTCRLEGHRTAVAGDRRRRARGVRPGSTPLRPSRPPRCCRPAASRATTPGWHSSP